MNDTLTPKQIRERRLQALFARALGHPRVLEILADCADAEDVEEDSMRCDDDPPDRKWLDLAKELRDQSKAILDEDPDLWDRDYPNKKVAPLPTLMDAVRPDQLVSLVARVTADMPDGAAGILNSWGLQHFSTELLSRITLPQATVWMVSNKTSCTLFATKASADAFCSQFPSSVWFSVTEVLVLGTPVLEVAKAADLKHELSLITQAFASRKEKFALPSNTRELLKQAANVISEDGTIIQHLKQKVMADKVEGILTKSFTQQSVVEEIEDAMHQVLHSPPLPSAATYLRASPEVGRAPNLSGTSRPDASYPELGSEWVHKNGTYRVLGYTNKATTNETKYPVTIVYVGKNGRVWSRPASDWHRSMKPADSSL